jgi:hypothetical protein
MVPQVLYCYCLVIDNNNTIYQSMATARILFEGLRRQVGRVSNTPGAKYVRRLSDSAKTAGKGPGPAAPDMDDVPPPPDLDRFAFSRKRWVRVTRWTFIAGVTVFWAYVFYDTMQVWPHINPFHTAKMIDIVPPAILAEREAAAKALAVTNSLEQSKSE